jgi:tRNA(adenine34) deaminase
MKPSQADEAAIRVLLDLTSTDFAEDVPVVAGLFDHDGHLLSWASNQRERTGDPTAHAEVLVLRDAGRASAAGRAGSAAKTGDWRFEDVTLAVTLEPCAMCAGAILNARIPRVVFGAYEPKTGAAGSVLDVLREPRNLHRPEVVGGVLAEECGQVLSNWFSSVRERG